MSSRKWFVAAGLGISVLLAAAGLFAHGGGLDSNGGHTNKKTGEYHYHQKKTKTTESEDTNSGAAASSLGGSSSPKKLKDYSVDRRIEALVVVMEQKGIMTREELLAQLAGSK